MRRDLDLFVGVERDEATTLLREGFECVALDLVKQALRETVHRVGYKEPRFAVGSQPGRDVRSASWMASTSRAFTGVGTAWRAPARTIAPADRVDLGAASGLEVPAASTTGARLSAFPASRGSTRGSRRDRATAARCRTRARPRSPRRSPRRAADAARETRPPRHRSGRAARPWIQPAVVQRLLHSSGSTDASASAGMPHARKRLRHAARLGEQRVVMSAAVRSRPDAHSRSRARRRAGISAPKMTRAPRTRSPPECRGRAISTLPRPFCSDTTSGGTFPPARETSRRRAPSRAT